MSDMKVDDGAMNSYSHPLAGSSGKRSSRSDSSGTSTVIIETVSK